MAPLEVIEITTADGALTAPEWLARAESVHRQLRPGLPADYVGRLREVFANGGRMVVVVENGAVRALALWRLIENTYEGRRLYVDDLVTDEARRSQSFGGRLFGWLEEKARQLGCDVVALDSGVQRAGAHRFYFREGMHIPSFCFRKAVRP
ncbi:MAG: GNAT family N-acetyltransferase [Azonexus sp.]|jgi:GNAT superfamily N-acetyltransferase|uniref:GNAT family N-acetyltransferase n=1 Tax=Azonexus sp. TaxID=1872668 RepID=UPI002839595F|nr:GNAT family N-acetyltransferase [Azonexus sp.]MDR0775210.1 GNAT family N-acetyltransferase [Azonexus sp.]